LFRTVFESRRAALGLIHEEARLKGIGGILAERNLELQDLIRAEQDPVFTSQEQEGGIP